MELEDPKKPDMNTKLRPYIGEFLCSFIFGFAVYAAIIGQAQVQSATGAVIVGLTVTFTSISLIYIPLVAQLLPTSIQQLHSQ